MRNVYTGLAIGMGIVGGVMNLPRPQIAFIFVGIGIIFALLAIASKK